MAITAERLLVDVDADVSGAKRGLKDLEGEGRKTPGWIGAMKGAALAFGTAGAFAFGKQVVGAASDLNETLSKTGVVFGPQTRDVIGNATKMADAFGLPKTAVLDAASSFGLLGKAAGLSGPGLANMSNGLANLAADASSFYNVPLEQALGDFSSALSGETEPVRKYGVLLNEAAVQAEAYRLGLAETGAELTEGQKVQARASLVMKGLTDASGDLARTQDSVSNQARELRGRIVNLAADFGSKALPAVAGFLGGLNGLVAAIPRIVANVKSFIQENRTLVSVIGAVVAGFAAAFVAVKTLGVLSWLKGLLVAARASMVALNAAMLANPVGLVVVAVAALAAALVVAYQRFEPVRTVINRVRDAAIGLWDLFSKGDLTAGLTNALGVAEDSAIVDWLFRLRDGFLAAKDVVAQFVARVREFAGSEQMSAAIGAIKDALAGFIPLGQQVWALLQRVWAIVMDNKGVFLALAGAIALVVAPIPLLIAGFVAAYAKIEWFRNLVNGVVTFIIGTVIPALIALVTGGISLVVTAVNWLISAWQAVSGVIGTVLGVVTGLIGGFVGWLLPLWQQLWATWGPVVKVGLGVALAVIKGALGVITAVIKTAWTVISNVLQIAMGVIKAVFSVGWAVVTTVIKAAWGVITSVVKAAIGVIRNVVELFVNVLTGNWRGAWNNLRGIFSSAWGGIRGAVSSAIGGLVSLVSGIPGRIVSALGNVGSLLYSKGRAIIEGLARGIRAAIGAVTGAISSVTSKIKRFLPGSPIKEGPLRSWNNGGAGKRLAGFLADGLYAARGDVAAAASQMAAAAAVDLSGPVVPGPSSRPGQRAAQALSRRLRPAEVLNAEPGGRVVQFYFTTHNPIAEPTSQTVNRSLQRIGALSLEG
jgi:phage-related protein